MLGLISLLASLGVAERFRKPVACIALVVAVIALLGLLWAIWLHNHDASVIERHEEKITDQVDAATEAANATANANDAVRQSENARADEQLRGAITDAQTQHPDETRRPAGPAVSGTLDRLRARQTEAGTPAR